MTAPHETDDSNKPMVPYGVFREGIGTELEAVCGTVAIEAPQLPVTSKVYKPGGTFDQIPWLTLFRPADFRKIGVILPKNFLNMSNTQTELRSKVPSLNEELEVTAKSLSIFTPSRKEYSYARLRLADDNNDKLVEEQSAIRRTLGSMIGLDESDLELVSKYNPKVRILQVPYTPATSELLSDLKKTIDWQLPARFILKQAALPKRKSKIIAKYANELAHRPCTQTRQTADDIDRMLNHANLRPSRSRGTRR